MDGEWVVLECFSRHEKIVAYDLIAAGIDYYLPLNDIYRVLSGKKRRMKLPLFPGYVFACPRDAGQRFECLSHRSCYGHIDVKDQRELREDLGYVRDMLGVDPAAGRYDGLEVGARCKIRSGKLQGTQGILISRNERKSLFVLQVRMLGDSAAIELDPSMLEILD